MQVYIGSEAQGYALARLLRANGQAMLTQQGHSIYASFAGSSYLIHLDGSDEKVVD